jgi:indole-3-glycerol phosphate synthase
MSKLETSKTLADIIADTKVEVAADSVREPLSELKRRLSSAPKINSFYAALKRPGPGLIAEIKECSPSKGPMMPENVRRAPEVYRSSKYVRAISVLTNRTHFGHNMTLANLYDVKRRTGKPILRKDFIIDEYQIYQARVYGADAILLMANILKHQQLRRFYQVATTLGMDVLFETHGPGELRKIPETAKIYGINSRNFCSNKYSFASSRLLGCLRFLRLGKADLTTDLNRFSYCDRLPEKAVKVAESGVAPEHCCKVFQDGFNAILVGTALLWGPDPIDRVLGRFEHEIEKFVIQSQNRIEDVAISPSAQPVHA